MQTKAGRYLLSLSVFSLISFLIIAIGVMNNSFVELDFRVGALFKFLQTPFVSVFMYGISNILQPTVLLIFSIIIFFVLYSKKSKISWPFLFSTSITILSALFLKHFFSIARPSDGIILASGWSFPSVHAASASVFFTAIIYSIEMKFKDSFWENFFVFCAIFLLFFVGISRIYLGVHFFTDVLGGFALGMFWSGLTFFIATMKSK